MEIFCKTTLAPLVRTDPLGRLEQFYRAAKKHQWDIQDLPWESLPPVPGWDKERWRLLWASVVQQQLQADLIAIDASSRLLLQAEETEAKLYYSTMVRDEARHVEGWTKLASLLNPIDGDSPYLAEMGEILREGETLEEQVIAFQVGFEGAAIFAFKDLAESARDSVLGAMASKLIRDDTIHHNSGIAYAEHLLTNASPALKRHVSRTLKQYAALYVENVRWRPPSRKWLDRFMTDRDNEIIYRNQVQINRAITALGIDPIFDI